MKINQDEQNRRLTEKEILERYQISHTTLWRWEREGSFPKGDHIGPNTKRWSLSKIIDWENEKIKQVEVD